MNLVQIIIMFGLFFLSYEIISFNEEFFIAVGFFSFLLFMKPLFPNMVNDFYMEDKNRFFNLLSLDINYNINFFFNFLNFISLYEIKKEFLYQNLNFSVYFLVLKFMDFYENFSLNNDKINFDENIPETIFVFYERILNFLIVKIQSKYMEYFLSKWDLFILKDINNFFDSLNKEKVSISSESFNKDFWIYG